MPPPAQTMGFQLHYTDFDRVGTCGATQNLRSKNISDAESEAREFLRRIAVRLPKQDRVSITEEFRIDVSDISFEDSHNK